MRFLTVSFLLLLSFISYGQIRYITENGKINFISDAPLELIKASSDKLKGVIDPVSNQFAFVVSISSFHGFNSGTQRDHFNEKYMESDRFPMASYKGKIIDRIDFSRDTVCDVRVKGELEMHGQAQTRILKCNLRVANDQIIIHGKFTVLLSDHKILVPSIINEKIAKEISVVVDAELKKK